MIGQAIYQLVDKREWERERERELEPATRASGTLYDTSYGIGIAYGKLCPCTFVVRSLCTTITCFYRWDQIMFSGEWRLEIGDCGEGIALCAYCKRPTTFSVRDVD
jgi:hypothetical protein